MAARWESYVRKVTPYTPGEQPKQAGIIKLNTNENPYPPCPGVQKELRELDGACLCRYPDPGAQLLVEAIARRNGLKKEQVFVGVGSDDVLAMCFMTFFCGGGRILFPEITYSFYDVWADMLRIPYVRIPLDEAMGIDPADYRQENAGIIFPNPNAPTGLALPLDSVKRILEENRESIVIVDEAYVDFGAESALPLIERYDNLLVVQTFSKSRSLAGLRIGCAFGQEKLIGYLQDVKYSFNSYTMNTPSILAGAACMEDEAYFKECVEKIMRTRERVKPELARLGFTFPDSVANFIFARHERMAAADIFRALREQGIFVRHFNTPGIENYLRITVGTDRQMDVLLGALQEIVS